MAKLPSSLTSPLRKPPWAPCFSPCHSWPPSCPITPFTHSSPLKPAPLLFTPTPMPGKPLPQGLSLPIPSAWNALPPDSHRCCPTAFRPLLKCPLLREVLPDHPHKTALLQPLVFPSRAVQPDVISYSDLFSVFCLSPHEIGHSLKDLISLQRNFVSC